MNMPTKTAPHSTPINKQSAIFLSRKRQIETVSEAIDGAVKHLLSGKIQEQLAEVFTGAFGPEPVVTYTIMIRRDVANPAKFAYSSKTQVKHNIGGEAKFYGLDAK